VIISSDGKYLIGSYPTLGGGNPLGLIAAAPDPCLELIEKIVALGKELKKRYDDLR
jgi:hypothetical protein